MSWKAALTPYLNHPEAYSKETILFYDTNVVIINDAFPKSTFHLLVIPRNKVLTKKHPAVALTESEKNRLEPYIDIATKYVYDKFMKKYKVKGKQLNKESFIEQFIKVGVHSIPSMNNLHIHVITNDFYSDRLKNKKHYNSFNSNFFINWEELPFSEIPDPKVVEKEYIKNKDLVCCYCENNFGNKFAQLKSHLKEEFNDCFIKK
ncbi:hypothetical protein KAFR_0A04000 [Kazachstania africana CBS 2517]|uniref:Aprataxin C2HE/C2H2/C2HC zinc finger domain-containing protein n=1 Tax=Kazachstania africana (strain ATCC 22294 / BCRC 22015 / CBS 2517 / CECT 1963 / NBRC 1671 / NRRL Y-8276) TaxID=1071382 RepID=H2AN85_KAZAF|nr:hypothetical protein KAFR_0A04000 [Kazachstania africana CBS 2517]CCF55835.1 hypothetical protein KAFR_0A04000 [Kazachstania africana CBS 2517]